MDCEPSSLYAFLYDFTVVQEKRLPTVSSQARPLTLPDEAELLPMGPKSIRSIYTTSDV